MIISPGVEHEGAESTCRIRLPGERGEGKKEKRVTQVASRLRRRLTISIDSENKPLCEFT